MLACHLTIDFHIFSPMNVQSLSSAASPLCQTLALRKQMARDLLTGELRVLKSAAAWLENYCATLTTKSYLRDNNGDSETVLGSGAKS